MAGSYPPRKPTELEIRAMAREMARTMGTDFNDELETFEGRPIAVFDDYVSDCPGYAGKVAVVVHGVIESFDLFIFRPLKGTRPIKDAEGKTHAREYAHLVQRDGAEVTK